MASVISQEILEVPAEARLAGLKSRLVSRLTGLSMDRLSYWHRSDLLRAHLREGQRGIPRLYSWVDYLSLQVASELSIQGVPTPRIREAVRFLDTHFPQWYMLPVTSDRKSVVLKDSSMDSSLQVRSLQHYLIWPASFADIEYSATAALETIIQRGPLCLLSRFEPDVQMDPRVNMAQPTIRGTGLETRFIAQGTAAFGSEAFSQTYEIPAKLVTIAERFEREVA